jgi:4-oxalocrotonate tautomerase
MPHVIVRLWPGKSEQQKARLAEKIVEDVTRALNVRNSERLYKKPGYTM